MSTRMMGFVALLSAYASIAVYLADARLGIVLYGVPIVLSSMVATMPRWNSPHANTLAGVGAFVPVCLLSVAGWGPITLLLSAAQLIIVTLYGLSLAEQHASLGGRGDSGSQTPDGDHLAPSDRVQSTMARELRRSRRTRSPVSLLLLQKMDVLESSEKRRLASLLSGLAREFDTVFAASPTELGVFCIATDRSGAHRYAERIRAITGVCDISIASFPEDAVTAQGLFDSARRRPEERSRMAPAIVAD